MIQNRSFGMQRIIMIIFIDEFLMTQNGDLICHEVYPEGIVFEDLNETDQAYFSQFLQMEMDGIHVVKIRCELLMFFVVFVLHWLCLDIPRGIFVWSKSSLAGILLAISELIFVRWLRNHYNHFWGVG